MKANGKGQKSTKQLLRAMSSDEKKTRTLRNKERKAIVREAHKARNRIKHLGLSGQEWRAYLRSDPALHSAVIESILRKEV